MVVNAALCPHSHPTSCCSAAEIMSVLFFHTMRYRATEPALASNDRFVLSKVRNVAHSPSLWGGPILIDQGFEGF